MCGHLPYSSLQNPCFGSPARHRATSRTCPRRCGSISMVVCDVWAREQRAAWQGRGAAKGGSVTPVEGYLPIPAACSTGAPVVSGPCCLCCEREAEVAGQLCVACACRCRRCGGCRRYDCRYASGGLPLNGVPLHSNFNQFCQNGHYLSLSSVDKPEGITACFCLSQQLCTSGFPSPFPEGKGEAAGKYCWDARRHSPAKPECACRFPAPGARW